VKQFIEKQSIYIGIGLVAIALAGGILLMVKKGASADQLKIDDRDKQIADLKTQVTALQKENADLKASSQSAAASNQTSNDNQLSNQESGKINLNTASQAQLESLPGIGPTYAQRIIEYRNSHNGFKNCEEVQNVKGIGPKTYEKFKDMITI